MSFIDGIGGDSVSKLVQARAKLAGIHNRIRWTGKGLEDIDALCLEYFHRMTLNECLWNGMQELMAMEALQGAPEEVQAKFYSIVLKAQANFELRRSQQLQGAKIP